MDRLDLELYADRLSRHSDRLCDEIAAARLRQAWCELEHGARDRLGASRCAVLEAIGVLAGDPVVGDDASQRQQIDRQNPEGD